MASVRAISWSQGVRVRTTDEMMTNLIKQQPVLTSLQAHCPVLTFVESVAGIRIRINLQDIVKLESKVPVTNHKIVLYLNSIKYGTGVCVTAIRPQTPDFLAHQSSTIPGNIKTSWFNSELRYTVVKG